MKKKLAQTLAAFLAVTIILSASLPSFTVPASAVPVSAEEIESLPLYEYRLVPVKGELESEFAHRFWQAVYLEGEYYSFGLPFREATREWSEVSASLWCSSEGAEVTVTGFDDLNKLPVVAVSDYDDPDYLHRVNENLFLIADYRRLFRPNGEMVYESPLKYVDYCICGKIPEERLYDSGWNTIDGELYYIKADHSAVTKNCVIDGIRYKFAGYGACQGRYTGWTKSANGRRYWKNGELVTEKYLRTKSGKRYYADKNGYVTEV